MIEAKAVRTGTLRGVVMGFALIEEPDGRLVWLRPDGQSIDSRAVAASRPDIARRCDPGRPSARV